MARREKGIHAQQLALPGIHISGIKSTKPREGRQPQRGKAISASKSISKIFARLPQPRRIAIRKSIALRLYADLRSRRLPDDLRAEVEDTLRKLRKTSARGPQSQALRDFLEETRKRYRDMCFELGENIHQTDAAITLASSEELHKLKLM
ncbi:MAG: hypothetical protein NUV67_00165 [archaeon]|nr:hypothetical protein [archaeon]